MAGRVVIFLQQGSYEAGYQAASLGITAASMGDEVYFVLGFDVLREYLGGTFGRPSSEIESAERSRADGMGVLEPSKMLQEARSLGAKVIACDTTVKISGFGSQETAGKLDEVMGLPSIWRLAQTGRVLSL